MTWQEVPAILERLEKETFDTLLAMRLGDAGQRLDFGAMRPTSMHDEAENRRILNFVADFRWPSDAPPQLILECAHRIRQAQELVQFLLSPASGLPKNHKMHQNELPDGEIIRWLLIDYWHYAGVWRYIFQLSAPKSGA